jgi:hypothetical protein
MLAGKVIPEFVRGYRTIHPSRPVLTQKDTFPKMV